MTLAQSSFHPDDGAGSGISLRTWLIGQALTGSAVAIDGCSESTFKRVVGSAFAIADEVIARLDAESAVAEAEQKRKQEERRERQEAEARLRERRGQDDGSIPF